MPWSRTTKPKLAQSRILRRRRSALRRDWARSLHLETFEDRRLMAFSVLTEYSTGAYPSDIVLADVNGDSRSDLLVANASSFSVDLRLGNGNGIFGPATSYSLGGSPSSLAVTDIDGDGVADLLVAASDSTKSSLVVLKGNGNGTFQPLADVSIPPQPISAFGIIEQQSLASIATGDLNDDGSLDLVVTGSTRFTYCNYYGCSFYQDGYVNVLIGNGSGGLSAAQVYSLGRQPGPVAIEDLNHDGHPDVVTAEGGHISVLPGNGTGALGTPIQSGSGTPLSSLSLGDIDGDGLLDTVLGSGGGLQVQKGQANGTFLPTTTLNMGAYLDSAVMGDVNADGTIDLVAVSSPHTCTNAYYYCYDGYTSKQVTPVLGSGAGDFSAPITSFLGTVNGTSDSVAFTDLALADLNGDGLLDLAAVDALGALASIAINDGTWVEPVELSVSSPSVQEGNQGTVDAIFVFTLDKPSTRDVSVDYATRNLTAGAGFDYTAASGTLVIPAGQTTGTITVSVTGDRVGETDETFSLDLSNPAFANLVNHRATGTIIDDEPDVYINSYPYREITEGNTGTTSVSLELLLSQPTDGPVTVDFATADGNALAGSDYQAKSGTVTFAAGQTSQSVTILVNGDLLAENLEYFTLSLTSASGASMVGSSGFVYILDDDAPPAIRIGDASIVEGNNGTRLMVFTVSLSQPSGLGVSVNFATANGTAKTSDNDYTAKSGSLYFAPGETSKTIEIVIKGDTRKEQDESFYVKLSGAQSGSIADGQGLGTILNDDVGGKAGSKGGSHASSAIAVDAALVDLLGIHSKRRKR